METLGALKRVKTELGLKTVLGVSNISFGLSNRELVNSTFLTMALEEGLDLPIINPNLDAICFDKYPTVIIATVLFAVHIFTNDTITAILA